MLHVRNFFLLLMISMNLKKVVLDLRTPPILRIKYQNLQGQKSFTNIFGMINKICDLYYL